MTESATATTGTAAATEPRALPSPEDIAAWAGGADLPTLGTLFEGLKVARFDALVMQIRKQEILPQHWQAISELKAPPDEEFDRLPEVGRLRVRYKNQDLSRRRLKNLKVAWQELRGKRPSLWQVPDLLAALRRILEREREVDFNDLLTAIRDVWLDLTHPVGKEQVEILWSSLVVIRRATKK